MPWHRLGTVSVTLNSSTVTGVGTGFAANTRIGDAFIGPDGRQYELGNVASDTVISIVPAYQGPTASGATYAVVPVQGYQKGLSDQVRDWVNTYGSKMAALGTTGNYDVLPVNKGGTGGADQATARAGLGLGSVAVENVVPIGKGGTGNTLGIASKLYGSGMVGAVTQSGGIATGTVLERGSNTNGEYIKYADGTLECWRLAAFSIAVTNASGGIYYSAAPITGLAYASPFVAKPTIMTSVVTGSGLGWLTLASEPTTTAGPFLFVMHPTTGTIAGTLNQFAIGRWF